MKILHTQSPWDFMENVIQSSSSDPIFTIYSTKKFQDLLDEYDDSDKAFDESMIAGIWGIKTEEDLHNVRLMAAAPELFEALSDLMETCIDCGASGHEIECAQAALAKARGEL